MPSMLLPDILAEIKIYEVMDRSCKSCPYGCWCDGDWSPQANLSRLYVQKEELEARMMVSER